MDTPSRSSQRRRRMYTSHDAATNENESGRKRKHPQTPLVNPSSKRARLEEDNAMEDDHSSTHSSDQSVPVDEIVEQSTSQTVRTETRPATSPLRRRSTETDNSTSPELNGNTSPERISTHTSASHTHDTISIQHDHPSDYFIDDDDDGPAPLYPMPEETPQQIPGQENQIPTEENQISTQENQTQHIPTQTIHQTPIEPPTAAPQHTIAEQQESINDDDVPPYSPSDFEIKTKNLIIHLRESYHLSIAFFIIILCGILLLLSPMIDRQLDAVFFSTPHTSNHHISTKNTDAVDSAQSIIDSVTSSSQLENLLSNIIDSKFISLQEEIRLLQSTNTKSPSSATSDQELEIALLKTQLQQLRDDLANWKPHQSDASEHNSEQKNQLQFSALLEEVKNLANQQKSLEKELHTQVEANTAIIHNFREQFDHQLDEIQNTKVKIDDATLEAKLVEILESHAKEIIDRNYQEKISARDLKIYQRELLPELKSHVSHLVKNYIDTVEADKLNMTDFALSSLGGRVVSHSPEFSWYRRSLYRKIELRFSKLKRLIAREQSPVSNILHSDMTPGSCFAFQGKGWVDIAISFPIYPSAFSIDHVARGVSPHPNSAPKQIRVYGYDPHVEKGILLADFEYTYEDTLQTHFLEEIPSQSFDRYRFEFLSNYGNEEFTCVYRVRIHGSKEVGERTSE